MADRKQTPDVLGEILGGEPAVPQPASTPKPEPAPAPKPGPKRRSPARRSGRKPRTRKARWEYLEVVFRDYGGYRPRYINGEEQKYWKKAPPIHEVLNQLGEQGWELVGVGGRHKEEMPAYFKRRRT